MRAPACAGLLLGEPRLALLVVVEVGREPAQVIEVLVALGARAPRSGRCSGSAAASGPGAGAGVVAGARDRGLVGVLM